MHETEVYRGDPRHAACASPAVIDRAKIGSGAYTPTHDRFHELLPRQVADRIPGFPPRSVRAFLDSDLPLVLCTGRLFVARPSVGRDRTGGCP